ncbi:MAG: hypothetical protein M9945_14365 [Aquamicrobium sp.]|uniref:hypothetical protein n=1 Tax=Aquamicrobium sp. TaxID=1872579 RepID=UPI00349EEB86|nr:hypothetical protein [Aquamicrobium sp.]
MLDVSGKMIYETQAVANMIAGKLTKNKGVKYDVYKVTTGFQVVPITVCKDYVPPAKPLPVAKPADLVKKLQDEAAVPDSDKITLSFKFKNESNVYIDVFMPDGTVKSFGKSNILAYAINVEEGTSTPTIQLTMTKAFAKKRGLI